VGKKGVFGKDAIACGIEIPLMIAKFITKGVSKYM